MLALQTRDWRSRKMSLAGLRQDPCPSYSHRNLFCGKPASDSNSLCFWSSKSDYWLLYNKSHPNWVARLFLMTLRVGGAQLSGCSPCDVPSRCSVLRLGQGCKCWWAHSHLWCLETEGGKTRLHLDDGHLGPSVVASPPCSLYTGPSMWLLQGTWASYLVAEDSQKHKSESFQDQHWVIWPHSTG